MKHTDTVYLHGLQVETIIGIFDWEKMQAQPLIIDVEMTTDTRPAARSDRIQDAIDYAAVSQLIRDKAAAHNFELLEALAESMAADILRDFPISGLMLKINKPRAISGADAAGIIIRRDKHA